MPIVVRLVLASVCALLVCAAPAAAADRTLTFRAGPYTSGGYNTDFVKETVESPQVNGFVTRMNARLVDRRGRLVTVKDSMLHHVFFKNLDVMRVKGHCTARQPEVFYSTGEENETLDLPAGHGYRVRKAHRWQMSAMLMSHRLRAKKVWIEYTVRVTDRRDLTRVRPLWVRANGCGSSSSYGIRGDGGKGSVDDRVNHWTVPISGRIVASGGHLHAGALGLQLRQPACGNRLIFDNVPFYGPPDAPAYTSKPLLHEAGPVNTSWWKSRTGVSVRKGEVLDLHGLYEGQYARGAVMAITHVYLAPDEAETGGCKPLPADAKASKQPEGTRRYAPYQPIPLWKLDRKGRPVKLDEPESPAISVPDNTAIALRTPGFRPENVIIRAGDVLRWQFKDRDAHNLTFASGPRVLAGQTGGYGDEVSTRFDVPGRYQLFCYLHPMTMREQITVLPKQ